MSICTAYTPDEHVKSEVSRIKQEYNIQPFIQKMIREIVWKIRTNEYSSGHQMPSIEELAKQYGVGRSTIREAIKYLQSFGLVQSTHGKGTFLLNFEPSANGIKFLEEIADIRRMIEIHAIKRASQCRKQSDLVELRHLIIDMENSTANIPLFIEYDRQFHTVIAEASGNPLLPSVFHNISGLFAGISDAIVYLPGSQEKAMKEHRMMVTALENQDEPAAVAIMTDHIDSIIKQVREQRV